MEYLLRDIYQRYEIPMIITENGYGAHDVLTEDERVHDDYRIDYLRNHISEMKKAIELDGVEVMGYRCRGVWLFAMVVCRCVKYK